MAENIEGFATPDTVRAIAEKQQTILHEIARKIEAGKELTEWERRTAGARLHHAADLITAVIRSSGDLVISKRVARELFDSWMLVALGKVRWDRFSLTSDELITELRMVSYPRKSRRG